MMGADWMWLGLVIYSLVLLLFLALTRREQLINQVPWRRALVGFVCCLIWPVMLLVMVVVMAFTPASNQEQG